MDWSNLREVYAREGSLKRTADYYGIGWTLVRKELARQGIPVKPRGHLKGQKKSAAWRKASAKHWNDPAWREEQRQRWLARIPTMNGPAVNSPLERLLHGALTRAGISFTTQQPKLGRYIVDIEITQKPIIIEADGNTHLRTHKEDILRDIKLRCAGYTVFRFNGRQINAGPDACIAHIVKTCGLVPETDPVIVIRTGFSGPANPNWQGGKQTWICERCGNSFVAYRRSYGRTPRFCRHDCQREWQVENPPINVRWDNYRAKQKMIQSELAGDCESTAEMTVPDGYTLIE